MKTLNQMSLFIIGAILIMLSSCDKAENEPIILLSEFNNTSDYGFDNSKLEYNASNQLVKAVNTYSNGDDVSEMVIEFKYNDQGQLIEDIATSDGGYVQKAVITRDGNTIRYEGYSQAEDGTWVDEHYGEVYTINGTGQVIESKYFSGWDGNDITFMDSTVYTWENENVVEYKNFYIITPMEKHAQLLKRMFLRSVKLSSTQKSVKANLDGTITMEYDDKLNPLSLLVIDYSWESIAKNNIISEKREYQDGRTNLYTYNYEYNENNYPDKVVVLLDGEEDQVVTFKYKEL